MISNLKSKQLRIMKTKLLFLILAIPSLSYSQDVQEILKKSDLNARGKFSTIELEMKIIRPTWERTLAVKSWSLGTTYSLSLITAPARDEGTVFLKRDNEIWNWIPKIGRSIKMPPSLLGQSWMGSDFTNDDLVKESSIVEDYSSKLLSDTTINGYTCYTIELIPHKDAAIVWGKVLIWISKTDYLQLRTEFYDEENTLINILRGSEVKTFGNRKLPSIIEMIPAQEDGKKTIITYKVADFDKAISSNFFSVNNMKKVSN